MWPVPVQFGLSPNVKNGLWLEARNAAVGDARGTAQLYAKACPPVFPPHYRLYLSCLYQRLMPCVPSMQAKLVSALLQLWPLNLGVLGRCAGAGSAAGPHPEPARGAGQRQLHQLLPEHWYLPYTH